MQGWEELLYENRNKSYGSYLLRKKSVKYLSVGLIVSLLVSTIPFAAIYFDTHHAETIEMMPLSIAVELNQIPDDLKVAPPPPELNPNQEAIEQPVVVDSVKEEQNKLIKKEDGTTVDSSLLLSEKEKASGNGVNDATDSSFYVYADEMPQFYGGEMELRRFLQKNFNFPESSRKAKKHGKVLVQFIVSRSGDVKDVAIKIGVDAELDKEVIRVISSLPKWKPGKQGGHPVNVIVSIPLNLKL